MKTLADFDKIKPDDRVFYSWGSSVLPEWATVESKQTFKGHNVLTIQDDDGDKCQIPMHWVMKVECKPAEPELDVGYIKGAILEACGRKATINRELGLFFSVLLDNDIT